MNAQPVPDSISRKVMWKAVSAIAGMMSALLARKLMTTAYGAIRSNAAAPNATQDPTSPRFSWPDALLSAAAAGIGVGIARVVSTRVAVVAWEAATGTLPPGVVDEAAAV